MINCAEYLTYVATSVQGDRHTSAFWAWFKGVKLVVTYIQLR